MKVLVVDDSALVRKLLGQVFAAEGDFEVQFARNGLEALDRLGAYKPDVITLDINMPQLDGLATLDRIMIEHPCPVVMVSSLTAEGAETTLEALRLGAVDFVAKPAARSRCVWMNSPRRWSPRFGRRRARGCARSIG